MTSLALNNWAQTYPHTETDQTKSHCKGEYSGEHIIDYSDLLMAKR